MYSRLHHALYAKRCRILGFGLRLAIPVCAVSIALAACGGSGDGPPCVETYDQGCLAQPEYEALVEEVAPEYTEPSGFQNQWGLAAINADRAYAHLELKARTRRRTWRGRYRRRAGYRNRRTATPRSVTRLSSSSFFPVRPMKTAASFLTARRWRASSPRRTFPIIPTTRRAWPGAPISSSSRSRSAQRPSCMTRSR